MLNNLAWDKPKQDILSLDSLIGWLETKPRFGTYRYSSAKNCMLAQYFRENGVPDAWVTTSVYGTVGLWHRSPCSMRIMPFGELPVGWDDIAKRGGFIAFLTKGQGFFGTSLRRARKLRAKLAAPSPVVAGPAWHNTLLPRHLVLDRS